MRVMRSKLKFKSALIWIIQSLFNTVGYRWVLFFNLLQIEHLLYSVGYDSSGSLECSQVSISSSQFHVVRDPPVKIPILIMVEDIYNNFDCILSFDRLIILSELVF
jgi:hypothetical protein